MAIHVHAANFFASRSTTELLSTSVSTRNREASSTHRPSQSSSSSFNPPRTSSSNKNQNQQNPSGSGSRSTIGRLTSVSVLAFSSNPSSSSSASGSSHPSQNPTPAPINPTTPKSNSSSTSNPPRNSPTSPPRSLALLESDSVSRDNLLQSSSQAPGSSSRFPIFSGLIHRTRTRPSLSNPRSQNQEAIPGQIVRRSSDDHRVSSSEAQSQAQLPPASSTDEQHQSVNLQSSTSRSHAKTSTYFPVLRRMQSRRKEKESLTGLSGSQGQSQSSTASPPAIPTSPVSNPTPLREHRNRRSLSQPPPIPRVVRSATDCLRHHRPSNNLPNGAIQSNSSPTNQAPGFQAMASPSQPLSAVGASHNNATAADVTIMQGMNSISADEARNSDESQSNQTLYSLRLVPHLDASRSLHFEPIERKIPCSTSLKIGRFTDRGLTPGQTHLNCRIAFKSKVVSRGHADIFTDTSGNFFIKDTKSSSGTFLNHIRLSAPGGESRPFPLRDGDILQLGVDYQGGTEEIYRCVKMRVELNRGWQRSANAFNQQALSQLRSLGVQGSTATSAGSNQNKDGISDGKVEPPKAVSDCCICLFGVTVCQALFIAPCSHTYHYKCIRPLLQMHHPGFSCPLCRTFADLEADVETEEAAPKSPVVPALGTSCILEDLSPVPEASGDTPLPNGMDASEEANFISRGVEVNICGVERSETLLPNFLAPLSVPGTVSALTESRIDDNVNLGMGPDVTMLEAPTNSPNTSRNSSLSHQPLLGEASSHLVLPEERGEDKKDVDLEVVERIRISTGSIGSINCSTEEHESSIQTSVLAVKNGEDRVRLGSHPLG